MPSLIASSSSPLLFVMALLPTFAWQGVSFRIGLDRKACNMVVDEDFFFPGFTARVRQRLARALVHVQSVLKLDITCWQALLAILSGVPQTSTYSSSVIGSKVTG